MNITARKITSLLLALAMILALVMIAPLVAQSESGACTHEHSADCAYIAGAACSHQHGEECAYAEAVACGHTHGEDCGYIAAVACDHQHDAACGGLPVVVPPANTLIQPLRAPAPAGGYTIQNTDDADPTSSGIYSWQQWIASPPTLVDGDAITITATAGPAGAVHFNFPGAGSVTGLAGTNYNNVRITANGNLTIENLELSTPNNPALTISTAATLTVTGACEVTSAVGSAMQAIGDLTIGGAGTLSVNGGNALICGGNLTVNTTVTATNTADGGTNAGVVFNNNSATLSGSGTLNATSVAGSNGGSGIRFNGSSLTVNGPTNLTIEGKDFGKGIYTEAVNPTITINRATATNITGGARGQGIEHFKSATGGTLTIANNGAGDVNISGGATSNGFGLQSNAAGVAFTGTGAGKINITGNAGSGIYVAAANNFDITFSRGVDTNITGNDGVSHSGATLTITNTGSGAANITGSSQVGIHISSNGNLTLSGGGPINAKGLVNGIYCDGNLTVTGIVNAQHTGDNTNYAAVQLTGATATLSGSGTLSATSAATNGSGLRFGGNLSISGLPGGLTITGAGNGPGIFAYNTGQTISFNRTNATTITGGADSHGIGGSAQTIINNGGAVNFNSGASGGAGIYYNGNLTLGGTGAINATGAGDGIFVSANNITLSGSGAISATSTGSGVGDRGIFIVAPGSVQFGANTGVTLSVTDGTSQSVIPCSQSGALTWTVTGDGAITAGTSTAASTILTVGTTSKTATIKLVNPVPGSSDNNTIDLVDLTGDILAGTYTNWSYVFATNTITVTNNVEVIGTVAGATKELKLAIDAGKTVQWKADYSGNVLMPLVSIGDTGTFEVVTGGKLDNSNASQTIASGDATVIVSGGTVKMSAAGGGTAIYSDGNVRVTGGTVEAVAGCAIDTHDDDGSVTVSGGTVTADDGNPTIYSGGNVTVSQPAGNTTVVSNTGTGVAISTSGAGPTITISGGTVSALDSYAIDAFGNVVVNGGTVTAGGSDPTIGASGDVEVSQPAATPTLVNNTGTGNAISANDDVTVRGGVVSATGSAATITAVDMVEVSDGTVSNTGAGNAIETNGNVTVSGGTVKSEGAADGINSGGNITLSGGYVVAADISAIGDIENGAVPPADLYLVTISGLPNGTYANPVANTSGFVIDSTKGATTGYNKAWMPAAASRTYTINVSGTNYTATGEISSTNPNTLSFTTPNVAPTLTGPTTMTLTAGYAATSTGVYTITGTPAPTVSKTSGDTKITWNNATKKLDIAAGLAAGSYPVVLTATNSAGNKTLTFTLTVQSGGSVVGGGGGGGGSASGSKITSKAGTGGKIKGDSVTSSGKQTFNITPNEGYEIEDVLVDGKSVGAVKTYTFNDATMNTHTIEAKFKKIEQETKKAEQPTYQPMQPTHKAGTQVQATKTNNALVLNGKTTELPAMKIGGYNWLKLRDFAMLLNGTDKQFSISYDAATGIIDIRTGQAYTPQGSELEDTLSELENATASQQRIRVNGEFIDIAAYNIDGYNYFRLRDLAIILNFAVIYDEASGQITLDFSKPYSE